jgi:hypothetical protein
MPIGFEPTIPVLERAKNAQTLDSAATVIGWNPVYANDHTSIKGATFPKFVL